jgi:N6-L-threonylcarbamoyladenine synthase
MSDLVLGIETSCDETAAAVVAGATQVLSSVVSSQVDLHARYGGVVPEVASRAHVELLMPVVAQAMVEAGVEPADLAAVAATEGPGLIGALLVGVSAAKALALAWNVPYVGVNHLEGHLCAAALEDPDIETPMVTLLVSGGHTLLVHTAPPNAGAPDHHVVLGQTLDDAAGEAFDKVARYLGLGYPGGPLIDEQALRGNPAAVAFPRPMIDEGLDFSFSGLKTAVVNHVRRLDGGAGGGAELVLADIAASFQEAVVETLVTKLLRAGEQVGATALCIGGGVAANSRLRVAFLDAATAGGFTPFVPSRAYCTDNAAMIAAAGWRRLGRDGPSPLDAGAYPTFVGFGL